MLVYVFPPCGLGSLACQSRHIRLSVVELFNLFLVALIFSFLNSTSYFSVGEITAILLEMLELVGHSAKALLLEEFMRLEELGLAQNEVRDRYAPLCLHFSL